MQYAPRRDASQRCALDAAERAILTWYEHQLAAWFSANPPDATIDKHELIDLWSALYGPDHHFCAHPWSSAAQRQVAGWVCGRDRTGVQKLEPDLQIAEWAQLVQSLDPTHSPNDQ